MNNIKYKYIIIYVVLIFILNITQAEETVIDWTKIDAKSLDLFTEDEIQTITDDQWAQINLIDNGNLDPKIIDAIPDNIYNLISSSTINRGDIQRKNFNNVEILMSEYFWDITFSGYVLDILVNKVPLKERIEWLDTIYMLNIQSPELTLKILQLSRENDNIASLLGKIHRYPIYEQLNLIDAKVRTSNLPVEISNYNFDLNSSKEMFNHPLESVLDNLDRWKYDARGYKYNAGIIPFYDVDDDAWYFDTIKKAKDLGYLIDKNGMFYPHKNITKAEMLKIVLISANYQPFGEVQSHWSDPWINVAKDLGIIKFLPDFLASREDVVNFISFAYQLTPDKISKKEETFIDVWGENKDKIYYLKKMGVIEGDKDTNYTTFRPGDWITRAETIQIAMKAKDVFGLIREREAIGITDMANLFKDNSDKTKEANDSFIDSVQQDTTESDTGSIIIEEIDTTEIETSTGDTTTDTTTESSTDTTTDTESTTDTTTEDTTIDNTVENTQENTTVDDIEALRKQILEELEKNNQ